MGSIDSPFGQFERAVCSCTNLPAEGACDGSILQRCIYGYRVDTECTGACGFVTDFDTETSYDCIACATMQSQVECDPDDPRKVRICYTNGEVYDIACSELEDETNRCQKVDPADPEYHQFPVMCVKNEDENNKSNRDGCSCDMTNPTNLLLCLWLVIIYKLILPYGRRKSQFDTTAKIRLICRVSDFLDSW